MTTIYFSIWEVEATTQKTHPGLFWGVNKQTGEYAVKQRLFLWGNNMKHVQDFHFFWEADPDLFFERTGFHQNFQVELGGMNQQPHDSDSQHPVHFIGKEKKSHFRLDSCRIIHDSREGSWYFLLGGGFNLFLFSPLFGEDSHFD